MKYDPIQKQLVSKANFLRTLFFVTLYLLVLQLLYKQVYWDGFQQYPSNYFFYSSDMYNHLTKLAKFLSGEIFLPHPLWHICVQSIADIWDIRTGLAAIIFSSWLYIAWVFLVYSLSENVLNAFAFKSDAKKELTILIVTFSIIIVGPLFIPFFSKFIYLGQGSPNVWHNVTLWMVKPFGLLAMLMTIKAIHDKSTTLFLAAIIATLISIFAKPSFVLIFLPAFFVFILHRRYFSRRVIRLFLALSITSSSVLLYQYLNTFGKDAKIVFDFLGVWSSQSKNIPVSILSGLLFPIVFALFRLRSKMDDLLLLSWYQVGFGMVLFACFAETGERYLHANFGWSYMIAMSMLYLFSILEFVKSFNTLRISEKTILAAILTIQVAVGIYYFKNILEGFNPVWTILTL